MSVWFRSACNATNSTDLGTKLAYQDKQDQGNLCQQSIANDNNMMNTELIEDKNIARKSKSRYKVSKKIRNMSER